MRREHWRELALVQQRGVPRAGCQSARRTRDRHRCELVYHLMVLEGAMHSALFCQGVSLTVTSSSAALGSSNSVSRLDALKDPTLSRPDYSARSLGLPRRIGTVDLAGHN